MQQRINAGSTVNREHLARIGIAGVLTLVAILMGLSSVPDAGLAPSVRADVPGSSVAEFQPNITWGGRILAVDVDPTNPNVAVGASDTGGLFKTTNAGLNWSHIDSLAPFRLADVKVAPSDGSVIIAIAFTDTSIANQRGVWRSGDAGATWGQAPGTIPNCATPSGAQPNSLSVAFAAGTSDVFVGDDCGVLVSHDLGVSWSRPAGGPTTEARAVAAQRNPAGGSIVDVCAKNGHYRSTASGDSGWDGPYGIGGFNQGCPGLAPHAITASPFGPDVLFAVVDAPGGSTQAFESDDGGQRWSLIDVPQPTSRAPFIRANSCPDCPPGYVDVYFGSGMYLYSQTCTSAAGKRCTETWNPLSTPHADQLDLAFNPISACPQLLASDGGIAWTYICGSPWVEVGSGPGGLNALQVYQVTGQVHPDHTDLYFGTQDNGMWPSGDNGLTWPAERGVEGGLIQVPHSSPTDAGQTVTFRDVCCNANRVSGEHFSNAAPWNDPVSGADAPVLISPGVYVQWKRNGASSDLYLTRSNGAAWTPPLLTVPFALSGAAQVSGSPNAPLIYQGVFRSDGSVGLIRISGTLTGSAVFRAADIGLVDIADFCPGWGSLICPTVFAVDPNDSEHLIAADVGSTPRAMKESTDGGLTWQADQPLTDIVTANGAFAFNARIGGFIGDLPAAHVIAFDPSDSRNILVGTEAAGVIASVDGGYAWRKIAGSEQIANISSFFFDEGQNDVIVSSYGRGLWKLPRPLNDNFADAVFIPGPRYTNAQSTVGATGESGPVASCFGITGNDVWYAYTPAYLQNLIAQVASGSINTSLAVWAFNAPGFPGQRTEIGCGPGTRNPQSQVAFTAYPGAVYYFQVAGLTGGETGNLSFNLRLANDDSAEATVIPGIRYSSSQITNGATVQPRSLVQPSEPAPSCGPPAGTVWYKFTPTISQQLIVDTSGGNYDTTLAVWTFSSGGDVGGSFSRVGCNDDITSGNLQSKVAFSAQAGTTYYFQVGSGASLAPIGALSLQFTLKLANDDIDDATLVPGPRYTNTQSVVGATPQPGVDPTPSCAPSPAPVWYRYSPTVTQQLTVDTIGSDFDTTLAVWRLGKSGALTEVTCNDNVEGATFSKASFTAVAGEVYMFQVGPWGFNPGNLRFTLKLDNDDFVDASRVTSLSFKRVQNTTGATGQLLEPDPSCWTVVSSVWYVYTSPASQHLTVRTLGSNYDTELAIWKGTSLGNLQRVGCSNVPGGQESIGFTAKGGQTYYFQVDGTGGASGDLNFELVLPHGHH